MRSRIPALLLVMLLLLSAMSGCACSSQTEAPATGTAEPSVSDEPAAEEEVPPLADEQMYRDLLTIALERYDMTIDDGAYTVLQSMEGYGAVEWVLDDVRIVITHREIDGDWEWSYDDEAVDIDSATPDPLTDAEKAEFLSLAKRLIAAVGKDDSDISELYSWKMTGGVMQADYLFGGPDEDLQVHISTDAEGHLGYMYLTHKVL